MLLRFGVENHGAISSYQELLLTATHLKDDDRGVVNVSPDDQDARRSIRVLPAAGIYGANAAGKSTVLRAFEFFVEAILASHSSVARRVGTAYAPFRLDEDSVNRPSRYDVDIVMDGFRYHYGFILDGKYILSEWLYSFDLSAVRQVRSVLFARGTSPEGVVDIDFPGKNLKGENKQIAKLVRPNSLFLSVAAQNSHPQLSKIYDFFDKVVRRLDSDRGEIFLAEQLTAYFGGDAKRRELAVEFLKAADVGISGIDFSKVPMAEDEIRLIQGVEKLLRQHIDSKGNKVDESGEDAKIPTEKPLVKLLHKGKSDRSYPIRLGAESAGTLALLQLLGPVFARLNDGGVVLIDELNSTLHPLVSRELINLFQNPKTNPGHAQLLFTTHDTNLLAGALMRRDQVWFVEKDNEGSTHLYSLSDIRVRSTDNIERGYLMGKFGAVPFMGCGLDDFASMLEGVKAGGVL